MKELDFNPSKSTEDFRSNYKLHDAAEFHGKNLLTQWGISFKEFGSDKRFEKVWEKGGDKPDLIINYKNKKALLDWKGKRNSKWLVNERAVSAYLEWSEKFHIPILIVFFVFGNGGELKDRRIAFHGKHSYILSKEKQWDKNKTIEFQNDIPFFNKHNFINTILFP